MAKSARIKLLFDAGPLVNGPRSGVGKYTEGLIQALADDHPDELELVGHYFDFLGRKHASALPSAPNIRYRRTLLVPGKVFNMLRRLGIWIPFELLVKERGDFHFFPGFIGWPSLFGTASAPMIHDITYIDFPQYVNGPARYDLQRLVPDTIRRAAFIVTNSQSSADGLRKTYQTLRQPILVEHIPPVDVVDVSRSRAQELLNGLGIKEKYLLALGTIEPRKNLISLLQAYAALPDKLNRTYSLVLAGGKGWYDADILRTLEASRAAGHRIYQTGYVDDETRAALYTGAAAYVLPSYYEGFGMQTMEAMSYHTPMLVSDIAVLHEVAGDSALYCDPHSVSDITKQLVRLLGDDQLQKRLVKQGSARLKDFNWRSVTDDMMHEIRKAVNHDNRD